MLGQITFRMSPVLLKRCNLDLQLQNDAVIVIHEFNKKNAESSHEISNCE